MPVALTVNKEWDYVLTCDKDKPPEKQTVFRLKILNQEQWTVVNNQAAFGTKITAYLTFGLIGWTNFKDKQGNVIDYKTKEGVLDPDCLSHFYHDWKVELAEEIRESNIMTEEEAKNSESPDTLSQEK